MRATQQNKAAAKHALPRRIALLNAGSSRPDEALGFILGDFKEAFNVYARCDSADSALIPEIACVTWHETDAFAQIDSPPFDTLVLAYHTSDANILNSIGTMLQRLSSINALTPSARLYAIACTDAREPADAVASLRSLAGLCKSAHLVWCGGITVSSANAFASLSKSPRMGILRRPLSEAIDHLILAIRCGTPADIQAVKSTFLLRMFLRASSRRNQH